MGDRSPHREVAADAFERLCELAEKRRDGSPGSWQLDYHAGFGGYRVEQLGSGTGVSLPFGFRRWSANDLQDVVSMLETALRIREER